MLTFERFTLSKSCLRIFSNILIYGNNQISFNSSKRKKQSTLSLDSKSTTSPNSKMVKSSSVQTQQ